MNTSHKLLAVWLLILVITTLCIQRVQSQEQQQQQQTWSCFGIDKNDTKVCFGRGTCISADVCECALSIYYGDRCQYHGKRNSILAWGGTGRFGNPYYTQQEQAVPVDVHTSVMKNYNITYVGGGYLYALVLADDGTIFMWGSVPHIGDLLAPVTPVKKPLNAFEGKKVVKVEAGSAHVIAMTEDKQLWGWGNNGRGQLAPNSPVSETHDPVKVNTNIFNGETVIDFKTKGMFNIVWTTGNKLFFWGDADLTGERYIVQDHLTQVDTSALQGEVISMIAVSVYNVFIVTTSNKIYGYGKGSSLGDGTSTYRDKPVWIDTSIIGTRSIKKIVCGIEHTLVLCRDGTIFGWGNSYINGPTIPKSPVTVDESAFNGKTVVDVYAVGYMSMAKTSDGSIYKWGKKDYSLLGDERNQDVYFPVPFYAMNKNIETIGGYLTAYAFSSNTKQCFGLDYSDPNVCNGRGICTATDNCLCNVGFSGRYCLDPEPFCYGKAAKERFVCSGRGTCIDNDSCSCLPGHSGPRCDTFTCFGVASNDSSVCSGHGICESYNNCICEQGYLGLRCSNPSTTTCFNVSMTDPSVCSGRGSCIAQDICKCQDLFYGPYCENRSKRTTIRGWGYYRALAQRVNEHQYSPMIIDSSIIQNYRITSVGSTLYSGLALASDGTLFSWGEYATGSTDFSTTPKIVPQNMFNGVKIKQIYPAQSHVVVLLENDELWEFGSYVPTHSSDVPIRMNTTGMTAPVIKVANRGSANLIVTADSKVWTSGYNVGGLLGDGTYETKSYFVNPLLDLEGRYVEHIASTFFNAFVVTNDQRMYYWGGRNIPKIMDTSLLAGRRITKLAGGTDQLLILTDDAVLFAFGIGALGDGNVYTSQTLVRVTMSPFQGRTVQDISAVHNTNFAQTSDGLFWVWGSREYGLVGDGSVTSDPILLPVRFNPTVRDIVAIKGYMSALAITEETVSCFGYDYHDSLTCSGHGTCFDFDQCRCDIGYSGANCSEQVAPSIPTCGQFSADNATVCSGHGDCVSVDNCVCDDGWSGPVCEVTSCYGLPSTNKSVCNGRGSCVAPDECSCVDGYTGINCQTMTCYNLISCDPNVCSRRGSCIGPNQCHCNFGYIGMTCELASSCFGVHGQNSSVCSGHGKCVNKDVCSCESNYVGANCNLPICNQQLATDRTVCSGNGKCVAANTCQCNAGYTGDNCEIPICYSVAADSPSVCSGHGICIGRDHCQCFYNSTAGFFSGANCSTCVDGYEGERCNEEYCDSITVCKGRGICSRGKCKCFNNDYQGHYSGENCRECVHGYYGSNCTTFCDAEISCSSRGTCNGQGQCSCFASESTGYFEGANCEQCLSGYSGQNCTVLIPGDFTFSAEGNEIVGTFGTFGYFSCIELFEGKDRLSLGSNFGCTSYPNGTFVISLGVGATLIPGQTLDMKYLKHEGSNEMKRIQVLPNPSPMAPTAIITAPREVFDCEHLIISGLSSFSTDKRSLSYSWSIEPPIQALQDVPKTLPHYILDSNRVQPGYYVIHLQVTSFLGTQASTTKTFIKNAASFPTIAISPYTNTYRRRDVQMLRLVGTAAYSRACITSSPSSAFGFRWTQVNGPTRINNNSPVEGTTLDFSRFMGLSNGQYKFVFTTYSKFDLRSNDVVVEFNVISAPLSASLGNDITTQSNVPLTLTLTVQDPENTPETPIIFYECRTSYNGLCPSLVNTLLASINSLHGPIMSINIPLSDQNKMPPGIYIITARFTKGTRSVTTSKRITFEDRVSPLVISVGASSGPNLYQPPTVGDDITFVVCERSTSPPYFTTSATWYMNDQLYMGPQRNYHRYNYFAGSMIYSCFNVNLVPYIPGVLRFTYRVVLSTGYSASGSTIVNVAPKIVYPIQVTSIIVYPSSWWYSDPYYYIVATALRWPDILYYTCVFDYDCMISGCPIHSPFPCEQRTRCQYSTTTTDGICRVQRAPYGSGTVTISGVRLDGRRVVASSRFSTDIRSMTPSSSSLSTSAMLTDNDEKDYVSAFMLNELEDYSLSYATYNDFISTIQDSISLYYQAESKLSEDQKTHIVNTYMKTITQIHSAAAFSDDLPTQYVSMITNVIRKVVKLDNVDIPADVYKNATSITRELLSDSMRLDLSLDPATVFSVSSILDKASQFVPDYHDVASDSKRAMFMIARLSQQVLKMNLNNSTTAGFMFNRGVPFINFDFETFESKDTISVQLQNTINDETESRVLVSQLFADIPEHFKSNIGDFNVSLGTLISLSVFSSSDANKKHPVKYTLIYHSRQQQEEEEEEKHDTISSARGASIEQQMSNTTTTYVPYCIYYDDLDGIWKNDTSKCSTNATIATQITCSCENVETVAIAHVEFTTSTSPDPNPGCKDPPVVICPTYNGRYTSGMIVGLSVSLGFTSVLVLVLLIIVFILLGITAHNNNKKLHQHNNSQSAEAAASSFEMKDVNAVTEIEVRYERE